MPRGGAPQWADHGSDRTIVVESTLFNGEVAARKAAHPSPPQQARGHRSPSLESAHGVEEKNALEATEHGADDSASSKTTFLTKM